MLCAALVFTVTGCFVQTAALTTQKLKINSAAVLAVSLRASMVDTGAFMCDTSSNKCQMNKNNGLKIKKDFDLIGKELMCSSIVPRYRYAILEYLIRYFLSEIM